MRTLIATIVGLLWAVLAFAQLGPGGVSVETGGNSNNKVWLDAGSIGQADGAPLSLWQDESQSVNDNTPTQTNPSVQPTYYTDLSLSINGHPIVRFGGGKRFHFVSKPDINTSGPYTARTTFVVFRTGTDVTTRQMIYEQGGTIRGLNIFIFNGELYMGGYDIANDADGTPPWGYVYTKTPIAANTTYVVSQLFRAPTGATTGQIRGFLNGQAFVGAPATGVGSLWTHPDVPGLGAINSDSYNETGPINNQTGGQPFLGDIAEFIAYDVSLNDAERIIVENYLGAKYSANIITNDFYDYQLNYGYEVIGIGQATGSSNRHNNSKGRNLFEIVGVDAQFDNDEYVLMGHNNAPTSGWVTTGSPDGGTHIKRIDREWRVAHTGDLGQIDFFLDANDLPPLPTGFTKYALIVDKSAGLFSDFTSDETFVYEMTNTSGTTYKGGSFLPDGCYLTIGAVRPMAAFADSVSYGFEGAANVGDSVMCVLNYIPDGSANIDFVITPNSATTPTDYQVNAATGVLTFPNFTDTAFLKFTVVGDAVPEGTENFGLGLQVGAGNTPGIVVGNTGNHTYTIYDDDNPPRLGFQTMSATLAESAGAQNIPVRRLGSLADTVTCQYRLRTSGGAGSATQGADYSFVADTLTFLPTVSVQFVPWSIIDDNNIEFTENVIFELFNISSNASFVPGRTEHETTITDNEPDPTISFTVTTGSNGENVGAPYIEVVLSQASDKDITFDFEVNGSSTASASIDYFLTSPTTASFKPGDTTYAVPLIVVNDGFVEGDETVVINLLNNGNLLNATLGTNTQYTYTIQDFTYNAFEFTGTGGVGTTGDNIFLLQADAVTGAHNTAVSAWNDSSPNNNDATAGAGQAPLLQVTSNTLNGRQVLRFDGTNDLMQLASDNDINTSTFTSKFIFVVFRTGSDISSRQVLYEQGGATRGLNVYLESGEIHFSGWNLANDDGGATTPWGGTGGSAIHVASSGNALATNTAYVATLAYDFNAINKFAGYLNGNSVATPIGSGVGRLYSHGDAPGIGSINGSTYFPDGTSSGSYQFGGDIAAITQYSNAPIANSRRKIVENHLAARYGIALGPAYYSHPTHSYDVAGIGRDNANDMHTVAQSARILRISNPDDLNDAEYFMAGHNNGALAWASVDVPVAQSERLTRDWRATLTGNPGKLTVRVDTSLLPAPNNGFYGYALAIDADGVYASGANYYPLEYEGGAEFTATNVVIPDGSYMTVITTAHISIQSGSFNDPDTWLSARVPESGQWSIVRGGDVVTMSQDQSVGGIEIESGGTLNIGSNTLNISASNFENYGTLTATNGTIRFNSASAQQIIGTNTFNNLIIDNAAGVSVSGGTQNITGMLTLANGNFSTNDAVVIRSTLAKTGSIGEITGGSITGDITMQRMLPVSPSGWHCLGTCISGATLNDWNDDFYTTGFPGSQYPTFGFINIYRYDETVPGHRDSGFVAPTSITNAVPVGTGFMNYISGGPYIIDMTGPVHTGPLNYNVSFTNDPLEGDSMDGWNLLGNPYPSDIDWDAAGWTKTNFDDAIYVWDPVGQQYTSYISGVGTDGGSQHIASTQSFWVHANASSPALACDESVKSNTNATFFKSVSNDPYLKLSVSGAGYRNETALRFSVNGSDYFDGDLDAVKWASMNPYVPSIATLDSTGADMAINTLAPLIDNRAVPLRVLVGLTGSYTITLEENQIPLSGLWLEDKLNGTMTSLVDTNQYIFNMEDTTEAARFVLHFAPPAELAVSLLDFIAEPAGDKVNVKWSTASELNNDYFVVERSTNGTRFEQAAWQEGAGTSSEQIDYATVDGTPYPGQSFYRLKMVDHHGRATYSPVRAVNLDRQSHTRIEAVPNPSDGQFTLRLMDFPDAEIQLRIVHPAGYTVYQKQLAVSGRSHGLPLDLDLPAGVYVLEVAGTSTVATSRIVIR